MSLFVSIAQHRNLIIRATGDVSAGWRKNERGFGFFGAGSLDYHGDRTLEITINVRVRPHNIPQQFPSFPDDLRAEGNLLLKALDGFGYHRVKGGKAGVLIAVEPLQPELEGNIDQKIYFDKVILHEIHRRARIQMKVGIGIRSSPPVPVGDIPEWDTQFFQGGLPGLGKRRP